MTKNQVSLGFILLLAANSTPALTLTNRPQILFSMNPFDFYSLPKTSEIRSKYSVNIYKSSQNYSIMQKGQGHIYLNSYNGFVILHEKAHLLLNHQQEKLFIFNAVMVMEYLFASYSKSFNSAIRRTGLGLFLIYVYRFMEFEADSYAELLLRRDFGESGIKYLERLNSIDPQFVSILHPSYHSRIENIKKNS
jgi:hypothetical protein